MMIQKSEKIHFYIDTIPIDGDLVLAPMQGFSDSPFRLICRKLGSAISYSEFINALDILQDNPNIKKKLTFQEQERPIVFQLFDNNPDRLIKAAIQIQAFQPDILDVNLGCSVRRVSGRGAGAGLLLEPKKVEYIFQELSKSLSMPITAKIRLGWDKNTRNYLLIARIIQDNGGNLIAVHARTRQQAYTGKADWQAIAEIKQSVSIPVIANGDVCNQEDIKKIKSQTNCDAVMIGRAAIGNPWLFAGLDRHQVPHNMVQKTIQEHYERMLEFYGTEKGYLLFRKHLKRYLDLSSLPREQRKILLTKVEPEELFQRLQEFLP